jgi:hypothetical protein
VPVCICRAKGFHHEHVCRFCDAVERALANQRPSAADYSSVAAVGATWAPNSEALAGAAAMEDGGCYVLENADPLTGSGMEGQRRREVRARDPPVLCSERQPLAGSQL